MSVSRPGIYTNYNGYPDVFLIDTIINAINNTAGLRRKSEFLEWTMTYKNYTSRFVDNWLATKFPRL